MFRELVVGFLKDVIREVMQAETPAPAYVSSAIGSGRPMSDVEAQARIRNLLNDSRFKFRKLGTLAKAIGRDYPGTIQILGTMTDVRPSRDNYKRPGPDALYTFTSTPVRHNGDLDDND